MSVKVAARFHAALATMLLHKEIGKTSPKEAHRPYRGPRALSGIWDQKGPDDYELARTDSLIHMR